MPALQVRAADTLPDPDGKPADMTKPVKVFILMGQSNMVGMGNVGGADKPGTLEHATKTKGLYPFLVDDAGAWTERKDVRNVRVMVGRGGGMGPKKGTQLFSDPRGGTFSTCPSLGTRLTRTQAPARSNAPAAAAIIGRCSAAVQSPRRIAVSIACESFGATQPQVDEAVVLDGEQRRDSRRLDEAPSARGDGPKKGTQLFSDPEQVAGARHDVERGEPAGPALAEAGVADIDRVENPHVGLHGAAGVAAPASAHVTVGVDQARHDHLAGCVDPLGVGRDRRGRRGADGGDFPVGHHHHAGRDRRA